MAIRTVYSIIKGVPPHRAQAVLAEAVQLLAEPPANHSHRSDLTRIVGWRQITALACPDALIFADDAWPLAQQVARLFDAPHLELRIQESDHWDFSLHHRSQVIADFSTRVSYFDANPARPRPWKQGDAATFARVWNVPLDRVLPYLIDWDTLDVPRLAVKGDKNPAGDFWQILEFMRAIGVEQPFQHPDSFQLEMPVLDRVTQPQPVRHSLLQRVVAWLKGATPEVSQQYPAVTIVRVDWAGSDDDKRKI